MSSTKRMYVLALAKTLSQNSKFKEWKSKNQNSYLVHFFKFGNQEWEIGYYNPNDTITSFVIKKNTIEIIPETKIFKKNKRKLKKLELKKIKVDYEESIEIATKFREKKYKNEKPVEIILILQKLDIGQVYNITFLTQNFNTLNIKIDTETGKVIKDLLKPLISFKNG